MSRGTQKSHCRKIVLAKREDIRALYKIGTPVRHIYRTLSMDKDMTYDTFLKYSRLCTRGITVRSHSPQRVAFVSQLKQIRALYKQGHYAKEIQKLSGLDKAMSYVYFMNYLRDYVKRDDEEYLLENSAEH